MTHPVVMFLIWFVVDFNTNLNNRKKKRTMKILLTGAFGNIGTSSIQKLIERGHRVRCFDLKTKTNEKVYERFKKEAEVVWGDLSRPNDIANAIHDQEIIVHLAFINPPISEIRSDWAYNINVEGTYNLLNAAKILQKVPRIVFASSAAVFFDGIEHRSSSQSVSSSQLTNYHHYVSHKIKCEKLIKTSGLDWVILRFGPILSFKLKEIINSNIFNIPLDTRIEFLHVRDAALAIANTINHKKIWGRTLLIGGGSSCQLYFLDYIKRTLDVLGVGMFPKEAFDSTPYPTDWMNTTESQEFLRYQQHSFEDFVQEISKLIGYKKYFIRLFRPLIRRRILKQSPYFGVKNQQR